MTTTLKDILKQIEKKIAFFFNFIILSFIYFFIIGSTALIAKVFSKSFLFVKSKSNSRSNFKEFKESEDMRKMY